MPPIETTLPNRLKKSSPRRKALLGLFLGPVEDLERCAKMDWRRDVFNASYLGTDGDVVEDPRRTAAESVNSRGARSKAA